MIFGHYHNITMTAGWRSTQNSRETILFTKIISFRFRPQLNVFIRANQTVILDQEGVNISTSNTQVTNNNGYKVQYKWVCPGEYLKAYCEA